MKKLLIAGACLAALSACSLDMQRVRTEPVTPTSQEVFWAKNRLAEQTSNPGFAQFPEFTAYALSNGDRLYCGTMTRGSNSGARTEPIPFYLRARGDSVMALNWVSTSSDFSSSKCREAASGKLRINKISDE
ncbi:hypothetical protein BXY66_0083 [Shimia isoporae]|uniref:Lipoprotein n=1 Tax=Shimia isoporae TaxID=647720 RepID=A0A4R1NK97_9RHOB|nr:hypothetical protein [Shimia isoporae]TCL08051.1 hypothetical protein BXY66_0083 [Shimia isoporae]